MSETKPSIMVYALSTCVHCKKAKEWLEANGFPYVCEHVDWASGDERTRLVDTVRKLNPDMSFPTIVIGDCVVVGFNEEKLKEALAKSGAAA